MSCTCYANYRFAAFLNTLYKAGPPTFILFDWRNLSVNMRVIAPGNNLFFANSMLVSG